MSKRTTLNDVYSNIDITRRLFYQMQMSTSGTTLPWLRVYDNEDLDKIYFLIHSGQKRISKLTKYYADLSGGKLDDTQNLNLSQNVKNFYIKKWTELFATLNYTYNPINNYDMIESEITESNDNAESTQNAVEIPKGSETSSTAYAGSEKETLKKSGSEVIEKEFAGSEKEIETPTGKETKTTEFIGSESNISNGTKTKNTTFTPTGSENTNDTNTETYNNVTDSNTEYGFNSIVATPPSPQNISMKTGSTTNSKIINRSFINRIDTTIEIENFDNYSQSKNFTGRQDIENLEFYNRQTEKEKSFINRTDTDTTTFNNRQDENEKIFTNREDTTTHTFSSDRKTTTDINHGSNRTMHQVRTLTRSGNIGVTTTQQMIQAQRDLLLWDYFYKVVFPDIDKLLTLSIY